MKSFYSLCFGLLGILVITWPGQSEAALARRLKVRANCILRYTPATNCTDFKNEFFLQQEKLVERIDSGAAVDLEFTLTDEQVDATHVGYTYRWISHIPETSTEPLIVPRKLASGLDQLSALAELKKTAARGLDFYLDMTSEAVSENNSTTVVYKLPGNEAPNPKDANWLDRLAKSPYYFNFSIVGSGSSQGSNGDTIKQSSFPGSVEGAYLTKKFKFDGTAAISISKTSLPNGQGGTISGSATVKNFSEMAVYSFSKKWDVAVINTTTINPASNIKSENTVQAGVEWILVPFRTTENKELAFRVGPQFTTLNLNAPNSLNHLNEKYIGAFAQIYLYWVTFRDKLMFGAGATGTENIQHTNYYQGTLSTAATYNVNSILSFTGQVSYSIAPQSISFPGNPDYSNPIQSLFLSGQPGTTKVYIFSMNLTPGNSYWKRRDRRWNTNLNGN